MNSSQLQDLRESAHAVNWRRGPTRHMLECRRCHRSLPDDQFAPVFGGRASGRSAGVQYLHPWCYTCKKQSIGLHAAHPQYNPQIDRYWARRIGNIMSGAPARGILVLIDKDDLLGRCLEQANNCAITGVPMTFETKDIMSKRTQASVDRIDSRGNYSVNNIQIVCNVVNLMKHDMPQTDFLQWCALALKGRRRVEDELLSAL